MEPESETSALAQERVMIIVGRVANCFERSGMPERESAKDGKRLVTHFGGGVVFKRVDHSRNDVGYAHLICPTPLADQAVEGDLAYRRHRIVQGCKEDRSGLVGSVMVEESQAAASHPGVFIA